MKMFLSFRQFSGGRILPVRGGVLETLSDGSAILILVLMLLLCGAPLAEAQGTNEPSEVVVTTALDGGAPEVVTVLEIPDKKVYLTFGLDRLPAFRRVVWGIPLWQYAASLVYIFLAFYVSKLLDFLIRNQLGSWADRTRFGSLTLELIHGPVKVVSFVILLHIGLQVFDWPEWVTRWLSKALQVVVALSLTYMALKFTDLFMNHWRQRAAVKDGDKTFNEQLFPILAKSIKLFVVVVALLVTFQNLGVNITGLVASLSIGGLAVGLAAQDTLANLFGAVAIFADQPFRVGDRIQLEALDGVVESIGLRSTRVRNLDGHLITVPNKTMGNATITNITKRPNIKTVMNLSLTYDTSTEKVKEALRILDELYRGHPMTFDVWISFNLFAESSLNVLVIHWWNSTVYKEYLAGMEELNLKIKERFDAARIGFAFPSRTVYLKQDSDWKLENSPTASEAI